MRLTEQVQVLVLAQVSVLVQLAQVSVQEQVSVQVQVLGLAQLDRTDLTHPLLEPTSMKPEMEALNKEFRSMLKGHI